MIRRAGWRSLCADSRGVSTIEFAMLGPAFFLMFMGMFDVGQMVYGKGVLSGAVETAARSSSLETGNTAVADKLVTDQVNRVLPGVSITSTRKSYYDFADIGRAEQFNDADASGTCNHGEAYTDENGNGKWDADIGVSGNGGANDVVIYSVKATYKPLFDLPITPASWKTRTIEASAIRKNQPYANQEGYSAKAGTCA